MKPFIIPKVTAAGKTLFGFQVEHFAQADLESLHNKHVISFRLAGKQTFQQAWDFEINFSDNVSAEFSSACTQLNGWHEIGSLNVRLWRRDEPSQYSAEVHQLMNDFTVDKIEKIVFEDEEIISECGLCFRSADGLRIIVAAGNSPGSVSVSMPGFDEKFSPQFPVEDCKFMPTLWRPDES
jgi:hypothetical protein